MARREQGGRRHGGGSQGTKRTKRTQLSKAEGREGGGGCLHPSIRAGRLQGIETTTIITLPRVVLGTWGGVKPRQFRRTTLCGPAGRRQKWREVLRVVLFMAGVVVVVMVGAAVVAVVAAVVAVVVVVAVMVAAVRRSERERDRGGRSRRDRRDRRDRRESTRRDWKE